MNVLDAGVAPGVPPLFHPPEMSSLCTSKTSISVVSVDPSTPPRTATSPGISSGFVSNCQITPALLAGLPLMAVWPCFLVKAVVANHRMRPLAGLTTNHLLQSVKVGCVHIAFVGVSPRTHFSKKGTLLLSAVKETIACQSLCNSKSMISAKQLSVARSSR